MPSIRLTTYNKARLESLGRYGDNHDTVLSRVIDAISASKKRMAKVRGKGKPGFGKMHK
jgi:hypothetical protein